MDAAIGSLQEVEPLKQMESDLSNTLTWQHVRCFPILKHAQTTVSAMLVH